MRILFTCKRHPQQRDLIERPYGRFHHLPVTLAALGHDVWVVLCSHHRMESAVVEMGGVSWHSHDLRTLGIRKLLSIVSIETQTFKPDWIIGCSDAWYGWMAHWLARKTGAHLAIDAYDNFEAYMPWNKPLHWFWRRALNTADLVTAAGPQLTQRLQSHRRGGHPVEVLPMTADPEFEPMDKHMCRRALGLPLEGKLIGYVGSWARNRGTRTLVDAFRRARAQRPDLHLLLSGHPPSQIRHEPGVICVGYVPDEKLPTLLNSLDLACVVAANTSFGRYSYPVKLCEAMACRIPVVASDSEPVHWMLKGDRQHLVPVGDATAFANTMLQLLNVPCAGYGPQEGWSVQAKRLAALLTTAEQVIR